MTTVSVEALKANFAHWASKAASGETVYVTRHNRPFVQLTACKEPSVHVGSRVGKGQLTPAVSKGTGGAWRRVLEQDRAER